MTSPLQRSGQFPMAQPRAASRTSPAGRAAAPDAGPAPLSAASARTVQCVGEEYDWLRRNLATGWSRERQSLVPQGERTFDVLRVRHADGAVRDYWFDVTPVLGRLSAAAPVAPAGGMSIDFTNGQLRINTTDANGVSVCTNRRACALPSSDSACDLMNGDLNAIPRVLFHCAGRSLLIAAGIFAAGERDWKKLLQYGLGAAVVIEIFALCWAALHRDP